jgi:hypothetical protein
MTRWSELRPRRSEVMEVAMLRFFGWMVAGGILLGSASFANAQVSQSVGNPATGTGYGYSGHNAYGDLSARGPGNSAYSGSPGDTGYAIPVIGSRTTCFTPYPLSTIYPYSYTGPGTGFGAYKYVPYPYAPIGYGWYGEHWRGW